MNDRELCDHLAEALVSDPAGAGNDHLKAAGPNRSRLGDVFAKLRELGIPWVKILTLLPAILSLLGVGGPWVDVLGRILALFGKGPPA